MFKNISFCILFLATRNWPGCPGCKDQVCFNEKFWRPFFGLQTQICIFMVPNVRLCLNIRCKKNNIQVMIFEHQIQKNISKLRFYAILDWFNAISCGFPKFRKIRLAILGRFFIILDTFDPGILSKNVKK